MTFDLTPDSIAQELLRRARLDVGERVPLSMLAHQLGLILVPRAPRGCCGAIAAPFVFHDGTTRTLAHELAHHAVALAKLPGPVDERLVAAVGARLVVPGLAFRRSLKRGNDRVTLAREFAVSETCAALRVGELTGEPVAIITPRSVIARGEWPWPAEDVLRRMVRQRARGLRVEQLGDDRRRVVVRAA